MQHLSREICERLAKAGYEQVLRWGDRFYRPKDSTYTISETQVWACDDVTVGRGTKYRHFLKCPSTGELRRAVRDATKARWSCDDPELHTTESNERADVCVSDWPLNDPGTVRSSAMVGPDLDTALADLYMKLKEKK